MKKTVVTLLTLCFGATAFAQLNSSGEGFYRVMSSLTMRYMALQSNRFTIDRSSTPPMVDMSALETIESGNNQANIVSNPASVFYIKRASGNEYDLQAQGLDTWEMSGQRYHLTIEGKNGDNPYSMTVTGNYGSQSYTFSLIENYSTHVITLREGSSTFKWYVSPVKANDDNSFFGITPGITTGSKFYTSFYASFAFDFASTGMKAYVVDEIDYKHGIAIIKEVSGIVPGGTPVIIECSSALPEYNRLNLYNSGGTKPTRNLMEGVYFRKTGSMENVTEYDSKTMRILGRASDGSLAFVEAPSTQRHLLANTAYLKVIDGTPSQLKIMTREEYDDAPEITVTMSDATREYGDVNPVFSYTVTGGEVRGYIYPECSATSTTNVGQYPITLNISAAANSKINIVPGTLTITKALITAKAGEYTRLGGEANPDMSAITYSGFKNNENVRAFSNLPVVTCSANRESPGGEYEVVVGGGVAQNYDFKYISGKLTVYDYKVKVKDDWRYYGYSNPNFSYTPENVLKGSPEYTTEADEHSNVGTYPVSMSRGTVEQDWILYDGGTLTVKPAPLYVLFNQSTYEIKQGEPIPNFILEYHGLRNGQTQYDALDELPRVVYASSAEKGIVNTYMLRISGGHAKNGNYDIKCSEDDDRRCVARLIIKEADPITIKATPIEIYYGDDIPELTFTTEGEELKGKPVLKCSATKTSAPGEYDIIIEKGTVSNYNVTYVPAKLIIKRAPLTISAGEYTKRQGDDMPEMKITYEGLKNGETVDTEGVFTIKPTLTCTATAVSAPGEYPVTINENVAAPNYDITVKQGKLTVMKAELLTITANSYHYKYGQGRPKEFRYTVSGPEMQGTPTITCRVTEHPFVGEYPIELGIGTVKNYNVELVNGTFYVDPADLYISVGEYKRYQGEENPTFKLSYEGFVYGDSEMVVTKKPSITTTATKDSPAGEYEIIVGNDGEASDYNIIPVNGKLIVEVPAAISTLSADGSVFDIYTTTGVLVKKDATSLKGLAKGVYIVNGKKVIVK